MEDDYGVVEAQAMFALKGAAGAERRAPRPLFGPPEMALALPQARAKNGVGQTTKDLTEHPWAGAEVRMTLLARDEARNEGRSAPQFRLPERLSSSRWRAPSSSSGAISRSTPARGRWS